MSKKVLLFVFVVLAMVLASCNAQSAGSGAPAVC